MHLYRWVPSASVEALFYCQITKLWGSWMGCFRLVAVGQLLPATGGSYQNQSVDGERVAWQKLGS